MSLDLWNSVQATDPDYTKKFKRSGGFRGTSVNGTYMQKRATEKFGPKGIGWGVEIVDENYINGGQIADGVITVIHVLRVRLWYKLDDQKGEVFSFGQTTFVGKNQYGVFTDEEAPKKSLTDATTKALSELGFCADIFLGLYDDNKYVYDLKEAKEKQKTDAVDVEKVMGILEEASFQSMEMLKVAWSSLSPIERKAVGTARLEELKAQADRKPEENEFEDVPF